MQQFRKRPITVDAIQYFAPDAETGEGGNRDELKQHGIEFVTFAGDARVHLSMAKSAGVAVVSHEDWIIAELDGSGFYHCPADQFAVIYGDGDDEPFGSIVDHEKDGLRSEVERLSTELADARAAVADPDVIDGEKEQLRVDVERLEAALNTAQDEVETLNARLDTALAASNGLDGIPHEREPLLVSEEHRVDEKGNPAGGETIGTGLVIQWQDGPLSVDGERKDPNGAFVEAVVQAAIGRVEAYQSSKFACQENADALDHLYAALGRLNDRTRDRMVRGVEGTHTV